MTAEDAREYGLIDEVIVHRPGGDAESKAA
jgi:ATP-dependent protease ClpP protease subunit